VRSNKLLARETNNKCREETGGTATSLDSLCDQQLNKESDRAVSQSMRNIVMKSAEGFMNMLDR
jgi:hypothetical protein